MDNRHNHKDYRRHKDCRRHKDYSRYSHCKDCKHWREQNRNRRCLPAASSASGQDENGNQRQQSHKCDDQSDKCDQACFTTAERQFTALGLIGILLERQDTSETGILRAQSIQLAGRRMPVSDLQSRHSR